MKVIIKGCAPFNDSLEDVLSRWSNGDDIHVWGINDQRSQEWWKDWDHPSNITLEWFQLHGLGHMLEAHGPMYLSWLSKMTCPVHMFQSQIIRWPKFGLWDPDNPVSLPVNATPFPVQAALNLAGGQRYITNSFSWLTALAILGGAQDIIYTGITVGADTKQLWDSRNTAANWLESGEQITRMAANWKQTGEEQITRHQPGPMTKQVIRDLRGVGVGEESWIIPNLEYWMGIAQGRGVQIHMESENHGLFYDKWGGLYGLEGGGEY